MLQTPFTVVDALRGLFSDLSNTSSNKSRVKSANRSAVLESALSECSSGAYGHVCDATVLRDIVSNWASNKVFCSKQKWQHTGDNNDNHTASCDALTQEIEKQLRKHVDQLIIKYTTTNGHQELLSYLLVLRAVYKYKVKANSKEEDARRRILSVFNLHEDVIGYIAAEPSSPLAVIDESVILMRRLVPFKDVKHFQLRTLYDQIAQQVQLLHTVGLDHRDIKLDNILCGQTVKRNGRAERLWFCL